MSAADTRILVLTPPQLEVVRAALVERRQTHEEVIQKYGHMPNQTEWGNAAIATIDAVLLLVAQA